MKKKSLLFILSLASVLSVTGLASCGGTTGNTGGTLEPVVFEIPEGGYDGSEVEIVFYSTMGDNLQQVFNTYLADFNAIYPNIKVKHEQPGGYDDVRDQIKTEVSNGIHPNLAYCYPDHVALYNKAKAVVTLDSFINHETLGLTEAEKADFIEGYWNEGKQFGNDYMYTLPFSKSTEVLYYNKTFFDQNGISVPTTWDELEQVCAKIKALDPTSIPLGYDSESNWFITMCEQQGTPYTSPNGSVEEHFLFNTPENQAFVNKFKGWFDAGYLTTQNIYGAYTSGLFVETGEGKQKSYMSIGSSAGATHQRPKAGDDGKYPFEVGIAPLPQVNKANPKAISQGPSVVMFKSTPQKEAASWLLLEFLTTDVAFQAEFGIESGYMPVLESVQENATYKALLDSADGYDNVAALAAKAAFAQKDAYFTSPAFVGSSAARDQVGAIVCAAMTASTQSGGLTDSVLDGIFQDAIDECVYNTK